MTHTARREGTPEKKAEDYLLSHAKPAKRQHVSSAQRSAGSAHATSRSSDSVEESSEGIRLQKVLAQAGVASRRHAEIMIAQGRVEVNGTRVTRQGMRVHPNTDVIRVDGTRIHVNEDLKYFILNKPRGLQSTMHDEFGRADLSDIIGEKIMAGQRLFHVGRLDADTEGLLLLTNDGELAHRLMHPKYHITKTYMATVLGEVDKKVIRALKEGVELDDGVVAADFAQIVDVYNGQSIVRVEIHEGRKHVVRRMLKELGYPVQRLVRTKIHNVQLGDQLPGKIRALNSSELSSLFKAVKM